MPETKEDRNELIVNFLNLRGVTCYLIPGSPGGVAFPDRVFDLFTRDLRACRRLEMALTERERPHYLDAVYRAVGTTGGDVYEDIWRIRNATPAQLCEAFVATFELEKTHA